MKFITVALVLVYVFSSGIYASNEEFPRIGATYRIVYPVLPEGASAPSTVTVISKGSGAWHLVEYERRRLIRVEGQRMPVPGDPEAVRKWINFDVLVAAMEQEEAEPDDAENGGKPLSDERTP